MLQVPLKHISQKKKNTLVNGTDVISAFMKISLKREVDIKQ